MSERDTSIQAVEQISVIGAGLLGASLGLALKAAGYRGRRVGVGRRRESLERALACGSVDAITTDLESAVRESQLVVLATPLSTFDALLTRIAECDHDALVITDVGSTKSSVLQSARRCLPRPRRFVGSHPMAGNEQRGPDAADVALFRGKPCIVTPEADTDPAALALVESLWQLIDMRLITMNAEVHDAKVAAISHVPHIAAVLIVDQARRAGAMDIAATGFHDTTRVASANPTIWFDILDENRAAIREQLDQFIDQLNAFRGLLGKSEANDEALRERLEEAKAVRDAWLKARTERKA